MRVPGVFPALLLLLLSLVPARAQVTVDLSTSQDQYLPGESLVVAVRIVNLSGQTLHLGATPDWLTFSVEARSGTVMSRLDDPPVLGAFDLPSGKMAIKRVDIAPSFALTVPDRYSIQATVRIKDWGSSLTSGSSEFDIIEGAKFWDEEVGVPRSNPGGGVPETRRYILQQARYLRGALQLYLRVTDAYGRPIRVRSIGHLVSFSKPEPQIDSKSNLHILFQNGPFTFSYVVCDLRGEIVLRQTYEYVESRPRLRHDPDGNLTVIGGVRRVSPTDIPPPKDSADADDARQMTPPLLPPGPPPVTPAPTNSPAWPTTPP